MNSDESRKILGFKAKLFFLRLRNGARINVLFWRGYFGAYRGNKPAFASQAGVGDAGRRRGLLTKKSGKRTSPKWIVIFEPFLKGFGFLGFRICCCLGVVVFNLVFQGFQQRVHIGVWVPSKMYPSNSTFFEQNFEVRQVGFYYLWT